MYCLYKGAKPMGPLSLTALRNNLFKVVDQIIKTGNPVEIERKGQRLKIVLEEKKSKLDNLKPHDCIVGDPDDLVHLKVSEWHEKNNL
jgi:hypothetical protein